VVIVVTTDWVLDFTPYFLYLSARDDDDIIIIIIIIIMLPCVHLTFYKIFPPEM